MQARRYVGLPHAVLLLFWWGVAASAQDSFLPESALPLISDRFDEGCGIQVLPIYTGEVFVNTRGGLSTDGATRYAALLDLPLAFDFEKLGLPLPGRFALVGQNTHGEGLTTNFVGDAQFISNIDAGRNIAQISLYWWEVGLFEEQCRIRLGKQDVNTEFLLMASAEDFVHSAFGLSPAGGLPSYPDQSMAAVVLLDLTDSLSGKLGIWDALSTGSNWGFSGNSITLTIGELELRYRSWGDLQGTLAAGMAYESAGSFSGAQIPSGYGYYVQLEQQVYRERAASEEDRQGLGVFASLFPRFINGPVPIPGAFKNSLVAGLVYRGLLPGRDHDSVGLGVAWVRIVQPGPNVETAIDTFYKAQLTPRLSLQPDLQYIASPSGYLQDALAAGIRFQLVF